MFGKKRIEKAEALARAFQDLAQAQAAQIETLLGWQRAHTAELVRRNAVREAEVTVVTAFSRHPSGDLSDHPVLAAAVLLGGMAHRSEAADDALLALAAALRDPLADAVDAILG